MIYPLTTWCYLRGLCGLDNAGHLLEACPVLPAKPHRPYLHRDTSPRQRAQAVLDHYRFVQGLPAGLRQVLQVYRETPLVTLDGKQGEPLKITCSPCGFDREGELMLTLYFYGVPVSRLSFSFIRYHGVYTAFIGGLQGPPRGASPAVMQQATRACHGMFPRRLVYEALSVLVRLCRVNRIVAVTEESHVLRHRRYLGRKKGRFVARYSESWKALGGVAALGFYHLPVFLPEREAADVPARKRSEYRRRSVMLSRIREMAERRTCRQENPVTREAPGAEKTQNGNQK